MQKILTELNQIVGNEFYDLRAEELSISSEAKQLLQTYRPQNVLIVYGSLAPGESNHHIVEPIGGEWKKGTIRGTVLKKGWGSGLGYPGFSFGNDETAQLIPAHILFSPDLPKHWARLDEFEGDDYQRKLAMYQLTDGSIGVGFLYAIHEKYLRD